MLPLNPQVAHSVIVGTLSYSSQGSRRHQIQGGCKLKHSSTSLVLIRDIPADEDIGRLPADGEYHGTFTLEWTLNGRTKRKTVKERSVQLKFTKKQDDTNEDVYGVTGTGSNEYGAFELQGTATKSELEDDPGYNIHLIKQYITL